MAEQMQSEREKDDIVNHVELDCVECRTSCTANVSSGNPSEEGIGECNRVEVHCHKDRRVYEDRSNKADVPIQPRERESSKKNLLKNRDEQTAAKNRDHPGG